jgi:hypothetical protein
MMWNEFLFGLKEAGLQLEGEKCVGKRQNLYF